MKKGWLTVSLTILVVLFLFHKETIAFNNAQLQTLLATKQCNSCDLSNANLWGAELAPGAQLNWANLSGANLSQAKLDSAQIYNANLTNANLSNAFMRSADLSYSNLTGANLSGTQLNNADLSFATWTDGITKCKSGSRGTCNK